MPDHDRIPSLDLLGDRLEVAAARSIEDRRSTHRGGTRRAGSPFGSRWVLVPALAGFVVLALLTSVVLTNGRTTGDTALADVTGAMKKSSEISTGTFRLTVDLATKGSATHLEADGAYDTNAGRFSETLDASALVGRMMPGLAVPQGLKAQLLVDRGTLYASLPGVPIFGGGSKRWFRLGASPDGGPATQLEAPTDPSGVLDLFGGVQNIELVGGEVIDGSIVNHYRGQIDLDRAYRDLSPADHKRIEESLGSIGGGTPAGGRVPVDVWLDDSGMVRRISSSVVVNVPSEGTVDARFTLDFTHLGGPVDIPVPSPDDVMELPNLSSLLGGSGGPGGSGAPTTTR